MYGQNKDEILNVPVHSLRVILPLKNTIDFIKILEKKKTNRQNL